MPAFPLQDAKKRRLERRPFNFQRISIRRLPHRREKLAVAARTDCAVNELARVGRLELSALVTCLVAVRLVLICDRPLGYLDDRACRLWLPAEDRRRTGSTCCALEKRASRQQS